MAQGSRLLNENGSVVGLNTTDLLGAMGVLALSSSILKPFGADWLALVFAFLSLVALIPIRLKYRRKTVRDTIRYLLTPRVIHDPKRAS